MTLSNVVKKYDEELAVDHVDLEVNDEEFLVLVGPSGCGKTSTLRMIAGLESITEGTVHINGTVVNNLSPKQRDVTMVFQNYALFPHMNVFDNIAFGLKLRGASREEIEKKVNNAADILGISDLLERKPKELSGGQRQRVALGRSIVRDPKAFLLDEPLANLDAKLRVKMRKELKELHDRLKATIIYVTHDQTEAMTMGDRIGVMNHGKLLQVDTPMNVYNHPVNMFVAGFMGSPSMNFLQGRLEQDGGYCFRGAGDVRSALPKDALDQNPQLQEFVDKDVILGARPEDVLDVEREQQRNLEFSTEDLVSFTARVEVEEPMGDEMILYLSSGDQEIVSKFDADTPRREGDEFPIAFHPGRIHLFDPDTEKAIL